MNFYGEINSGYCIDNAHPDEYISGNCDHFKRFFPFNFFGICGVISFCREWFDYMALFGEGYFAFDKIRECTFKTLRESLPSKLVKDDRLYFSHWGHHSRSGLRDIEWWVMNKPIRITASVSPSFVIDNFYSSGGVAYFDSYVKCDLNLTSKLTRQLQQLDFYNKDVLKDYINNNTGKWKKHQPLIDELTKKIKNYEII